MNCAVLLHGFWILAAASVMAISYGCSSENKPAPVPTINPDAHVTATVRISVSDIHVDDVKVVSIWQLGNFKCAPIIMPEGYLKNKPVQVNEEMTKTTNYYEAKVLLDRFRHNKCNWFLAVNGIEFMSDGKIYTIYAFDPDQLDNHNVQEIICMPSRIGGGVCVHRKLNLAEKKIEHKFDATVEYLP